MLQRANAENLLTVIDRRVERQHKRFRGMLSHNRLNSKRRWCRLLTMQAAIRYAEDRDTFEFQPPDSEDAFESQSVPDEGCMVFDDEDTGKLYFVTLFNWESDDLEADTVYTLTAVETVVEDEDEDEEEAEDVTSTTGNGNHGD